MYVYCAACSPTCLLLNYLHEAPCHGLSAALQSLCDKKMTGCWRLKRCFLGPKSLKQKDLVSVRNSSSFLKIAFLLRIFTGDNLLWLYTLSSQKKRVNGFIS